jgi:hypothetical protein
VTANTMHGTHKITRNRSRITSGRSLLPHGVDMRGVWERRWTDLNTILLADQGGPDVCSEAEKSIIRRSATLIVALERLETKFAEQEDGGSPNQLDQYQRLSNTLRRLLESVGLKRRPRDITPDLQSYLASKTNTPTRRERVRAVTIDHEDDD